MSEGVIPICGKTYSGKSCYAEKFGKIFKFPDKSKIGVWHENTKS